MKRKRGIPSNFHLLQREKPNYRQACEGKFSQILTYTDIEIRFWEHNFKDYNKAVFICSIFPLNENASKANNYSNYIHISTELEFCIYYDALYELYMLISKWKYLEMYIGGEQCYPDELWIYMHHIIRSSNIQVERFNIKAAIKDYSNPWKHEKEVYHIICKLFPSYDVVSHYRASWLENLELDIYIEDMNIGIEYQGIQHYKPLKHWGGKEGFITRRANDIRKKNLCQAHGTKLIEFSYLDEITEELVAQKLSPYII